MQVRAIQVGVKAKAGQGWSVFEKLHSPDLHADEPGALRDLWVDDQEVISFDLPQTFASLRHLSRLALP